VLALGGLGWIVYSLSSAGQAALEAVPLTGLDDPAALLEAARGSTLGDPNAPVQILVFSDYTCPSCQFWVTAVEPYVKQEYIETGKVRLVHYDFPLGGVGQHQHSFIAARAARCAEDQNRFWDYHDKLLGRQSEWSPKPNPPLGDFID
jgi:protein-disulfide isomerase